MRKNNTGAKNRGQRGNMGIFYHRIKTEPVQDNKTPAKPLRNMGDRDSSIQEKNTITVRKKPKHS